LPAPFTLFVAAGVIATKEILYRRVSRVGKEVGSTAVTADAWHHRADAISSLAAFIGISIALIGGPGWEAADDWAALVAALVVAVNGIRTLRPAIAGLMDEAPDRSVKERALDAASGVAGVRSVENLNVRSYGLGFYVDLHVKADANISLEAAHEIAANVKYAILEAVPSVVSVLVHMEPYRDSLPLAREAILSAPPL
jgi:cation diffusion facilitator family transporter